MEVYRTPEERFGDLPGFPYEPHYREWEGIRLAHVDEGEGSPVLLLHGEPTWSYLYRKVIARLLEAGHRCIAPELPLEEVFFLVLLCWLTMNLLAGSRLVLDARERRRAASASLSTGGDRA